VPQPSVQHSFTHSLLSDMIGWAPQAAETVTNGSQCVRVFERRTGRRSPSIWPRPRFRSAPCEGDFTNAFPQASRVICPKSRTGRKPPGQIGGPTAPYHKARSPAGPGGGGSAEPVGGSLPCCHTGNASRLACWRPEAIVRFVRLVGRSTSKPPRPAWMARGYHADRVRSSSEGSGSFQEPGATVLAMRCAHIAAHGRRAQEPATGDRMTVFTTDKDGLPEIAAEPSHCRRSPRS
jgi:hypothetical protein